MQNAEFTMQNYKKQPATLPYRAKSSNFYKYVVKKSCVYIEYLLSLRCY